MSASVIEEAEVWLKTALGVAELGEREKGVALSLAIAWWRADSLRAALLARHRDGERAETKWEIERIGADWLAGACCRMVDEGFIDARSEIGDALLDYASMRHGDREPIANVRTEYVRLKERRYAPPSPERESAILATPPAASPEPSDTQRLDALEAILGNLDAKTEVFLAGLGTTGTARAFQCEIAPATSEGSMAWRSYQGSALRAAIDAAVASTPTEGDPNHE